MIETNAINPVVNLLVVVSHIKFAARFPTTPNPEPRAIPSKKVLSSFFIKSHFYCFCGFRFWRGERDIRFSAEFRTLAACTASWSLASRVEPSSAIPALPAKIFK